MKLDKLNQNKVSQNSGSKRDRSDGVNSHLQKKSKADVDVDSSLTKSSVPHCQFELATTNSESLDILSTWFQGRKFTGLENLEFKNSATCGNSLGCFAKKDFSVGDMLFSVPQSCILGLGLTMDHPIANFVFHEAKKHQCFDRVSIELLVWLVMIDGKYIDHENVDDDDSDDEGHIPPLHVYLSSLSDPSPSLLHWDPELCKALEGTNLGTSLKTLESTLKAHAEFLVDLSKWNKKGCVRLLPPKYFNYDSLLWACGHYLSRRYPGHFATQIYHDLTVDDNKFSRESNFGNVGALVPLLDILNHNDEHEWLKFEVKNNALHVICNHPVKTGEELFSNYGGLSNEQLLFAYGYCTAQNSNDVFSIKLKVPSVMSTTAPVLKKRGSVDSVTKQFALRGGGWDGIPKVSIEK
jgi:hypothetical protein